MEYLQKEREYQIFNKSEIWGNVIEHLNSGVVVNVTANPINLSNGLLRIGLNDTGVPFGIDRVHPYDSRIGSDRI